MEPITRIEGTAVPLDRADVDTDQIIPAQYLKRIERTGFGPFLFDEWRKDPDFVLNDARYAGASILLAGPNFGCGSSREHAPWAIEDDGFRAVIAPSFADIFRNNCLKIGLLPIELRDESVRALMDAVLDDPTTRDRRRPGRADGARARARRGLRHGAVHAVAPDGRARRHRAHAAAHRRDRRLRGRVGPAGCPPRRLHRMELTARRLEPAEWPEAARVIVCIRAVRGAPRRGRGRDRRLRGRASARRGSGRPVSDVRVSQRPARGRAPSLARLSGVPHANHPNRPHWFVGEVGVEPGLRRAGIGTLALEELMRSITGAGMVCVEAEDDLVGFYERVGFRPTLRTPAPDGAPVTFLEAYV